jgi:hypothetical protein
MQFKDILVGDKFVLARPENKKVLTKEKHIGEFMSFMNSKRMNGEWCFVEWDAEVILLH